jgi:type II secretory pathway component PulF
MEPPFPTFRRFVSREVPLPLISRWPATRLQRNSLLRLIAVSIEHSLPLMPLLENWAEDERGYQRVRLRKLVTVLKNGRNLPDAIEEVGGILEDEDILAIRFDAQMGTRTAAVRQLLNSDIPHPSSPTRQVRGDLLYVASVIVAALLIIPFLHLKIVPVFQKILMEFSAEQPPVLLWSMAVARIFISFWWIFALVCLAIGWCILSTSAGRFIRRSFFDRWSHSLRELHAASVLRKLEIATAAGRPIPGALSTLARYYSAPQIRHKLLFVRNEVEQGADVWQSMAAVDLLSPPELRLLKTTDRIGNRSWALGQLAAVKTNRTMRRFDVLAQCLLPALVLLLGAIVLSQALMIFQPLVVMIEGLL